MAHTTNEVVARFAASRVRTHHAFIAGGLVFGFAALVLDSPNIATVVATIVGGCVGVAVKKYLI